MTKRNDFVHPDPTQESDKLEAGRLLLVQKPKGWTSFDVVREIRELFRIRKIGHAGTLDPMASGLLIVCTGRMTKEIERLKNLSKEYRGVMELGARTKSFDAETEVYERRPLNGIDEEAVRELFPEFVGELEQSPPLYSAVKYHGKRLYKYARKGKVIDPPRRHVTVFEFEPLEIRIPPKGGQSGEVEFRIVSSGGTYVRSIVEEFGLRLGCGAYLKELVRTRIGEFRLEDSLTIDELKQLAALE